MAERKWIMEMKTEEAWAKLNRWERCLVAWRACGRTGLTVQNICALTERSMERTFSSMLKHPAIYVQHCSTVKAPVWALRMQWIQHLNSAGNGYIIEGCTFQPSTASNGLVSPSMTEWVETTKLLNSKYPYPKWQGVENMTGLAEISRVKPNELKFIKGAIENKWLPYSSVYAQVSQGKLG